MALRILVVRNDKLGDLMLAWPAFRLLKERCPQARITALVREYTREAAAMCPWVDEVLVDPEPQGRLLSAVRLARLLRERRFDAAITLFSTGRVGLACALARIPYRLAPATKLAQFFYSVRLVQRRSRSEKPEYAYNRDLAARFLRDHGMAIEPLPGPPYLRFDPDQTAARREALLQEQGWSAATRLVFVHPGSGGSASNLSPAQYAELLRTLHAPRPLAFVISAGPGEEAIARELQAGLDGLPSVIYRSSSGLAEFARQLACADLFISGSTGPLHIAGALDVPTAAFYPRRRSATPLRWQTLNSPERRLAFTPPADAGEFEMGAIDLAAAAAGISELLC